MNLNPALKLISEATPAPETPRQMLARIQAMREEREDAGIKAACAFLQKREAECAYWLQRERSIATRLAVTRHHARNIRFRPDAEHVA